MPPTPRFALCLVPLIALALSACSPPSAVPTSTAAPVTPPATLAASTATPPAPTGTPTEPATAVPTVAATATSPAPALVPGLWMEMVYHAGLGQMVLVNGGPESGKLAADPLEVWGWDGAAWTLLSADPAGPRWRNAAVVAYDEARQALVVMGGSQPFQQVTPEMWLWDGVTWTQFTGGLPPGPGYGALAYDAGRERLVLFGGNDAQFNLLAETWEWDGLAWSQVGTDGPAARFPGAMTYDVARGEVLLFGGHSPSSGGSFRDWGDTWGWDGTAWREYTPAGPVPGARPATRAAYHAGREQVLLFGGAGSGNNAEVWGDTWVWDGARWTPVEAAGPSARAWHALAYDPEHAVVVLFGGYSAPPYLGTAPLTDTWEWDGAAWHCLAGCAP